MDAPYHGPAVNGLGMPVIGVKPATADRGAVIDYAVLYRDGSSSSASSHRDTESAADLLAMFDAMAESHRSAAKQRAGRKGPQCAGNVGRGSELRQCSFTALPESPYCGRCQKKAASSDDFEAAPNLADTPDSFAW